jgi:hypothetical protein
MLSQSGPHPQPDFAYGGYGTRVANKINAAGSTNPVIWTALTGTSPEEVARNDSGSDRCG